MCARRCARVVSGREVAAEHCRRACDCCRGRSTTAPRSTRRAAAGRRRRGSRPGRSPRGEHRRERLDQRRVHRLHVRERRRCRGVVQVLAVEQRQELRVGQIVVPREAGSACGLALGRRTSSSDNCFPALLDAACVFSSTARNSVIPCGRNSSRASACWSWRAPQCGPTRRRPGRDGRIPAWRPTRMAACVRCGIAHGPAQSGVRRRGGLAHRRIINRMGLIGANPRGAGCPGASVARRLRGDAIHRVRSA